MKLGCKVNGTHLSRGGTQRLARRGSPCKCPLACRGCPRLLEKCDTGRFLVPYFVLIFANVKIKDKSESQQGFNKQETNKQKNTGWINIVWKPLLRAVAFDF